MRQDCQEMADEVFDDLVTLPGLLADDPLADVSHTRCIFSDLDQFLDPRVGLQRVLDLAEVTAIKRECSKQCPQNVQGQRLGIIGSVEIFDSVSQAGKYALVVP